MKVILNEDIVSLGIEGDVLNVADGYARNYLIPKGLAVRATPGNLKDLEFRRKAIEKKEVARKAEAEVHAKKFEGKKIEILAKVAEEGKLYGSVSISEVTKALEEQLKEAVDKRQIVMHDHIKEVGTYPVLIRLHPEVEATVELEVLPEDGERVVKPAEDQEIKEKKTKKSKKEKEVKETAETETKSDIVEEIEESVVAKEQEEPEEKQE